ncbi:hypothetical protein Tco_1468515 [Tanacetum coccineum]
MDDYKLIFGMDFFDKVQAIPITFTNTLCSLDKGRVCMVEMERGTKSGSIVMSKMQLKSVFKELNQISRDVETLRDAKDVLEEVRGVISSDLPEQGAQESFHKGLFLHALRSLFFKPLTLSLTSMPSCDLKSLTNILILYLILKASNQSLRKSLSLNLELS